MNYIRFRFVALLCILAYSLNLFAYDTEIDGLRYDWVSYYNASRTSGDVSLVSYSSLSLTENLSIPCHITWNEQGKGHKGRSCQVCTVEKNAFENCSIIKSVTFGCVQSIMSNAFKDCTSLQAIYFSNTIISILPSSFSGCTSLSEIHIDNSTPPTGLYEDSFDEITYKNAILYVPKGSVDEYKNSNVWNKFMNISDGLSNTFTLSITATGNGSVTYDGTTTKNNTNMFTVQESASAAIILTPDDGYRIKSVKVNDSNVTANLSNNQYIVDNIIADITVEVEFEANAEDIDITKYISASYEPTYDSSDTQQYYRFSNNSPYSCNL